MDRSTILSSFSIDLKKELELIESDNYQTNELDSFNKDNHFQKMGICCELVSKECTKMAVAFSKPPFPSNQDASFLLRDIGKALDMLVAWYKSFPLSEGKTLHKILQHCVAAILDSVHGFVESIDTLSQDDEKNNDRLIATGGVWESCNLFKKLPTDNTSAVIKNINASYKLVSDAISEINQSVDEFEEEKSNENNNVADNDYSDDEESWTDDNVKLIKPCVGLVMASKGLLKKTKSTLVTAQKNQSDVTVETDALMDRLELLSPNVDDLVMCLYPPCDEEQICKQAEKISENIKSTLLFVQNSSCVSGSTTENLAWITFIRNAVEQNFTKLMSLATLHKQS